MKRSRSLRALCALCAAVTLLSACVGRVRPEPAPPQSIHPRLFFDPNDLPTLRARAKTTHAEIWSPIKDYVDTLLGSSPPAAAPADGDLNSYRRYGDRLVPLAFACLIAEDTRYCDLAKTYLLTYASWRQWGEYNYRDLGLAHMLLGNAIAYDWLYGQLAPAERQIVRMSLAGWAQKMYEASAAFAAHDQWRNWWRQAYTQNHNWTNHSALGMAGLALLGEDRRDQLWINQASGRMQRVQALLNGIADGSWHEGIDYQSYGLTLSLPFMVNLRKLLSVDILPHVYLQHYSYWRIYNHIPRSTQFILAYADYEWSWGNAFQPQNVLRFIAKEYRDRHAEWMAGQLIAADKRHTSIDTAPWYVFEFLYYDASISPQAPLNLARVRTFPDLGAVIWRTGWGDDDLVFGLKGGAYGGQFGFDTFTREAYPWEPPCANTGCAFHTGHDHDDTNGFYLYRAGQWLAPEHEGVGLSATEFHNTLLIDGQGQYRPPDDHYGQFPADFIGGDGFLEATADTPHFNYVAATATRRYKHITDLKDATRHVVFVRPRYLVMLDNLSAAAAHQYQWVSHFGESVAVEGGWIRGNAGGEQILGVGVFAPIPFDATTGNDGRPYIHLRPVTDAGDVRFINILYPTDAAGWASRPAIIPLDDSAAAAAVRVEMRDGSELTDDVLIAYAQPSAAAAIGPYLYDGRVAVITRSGNVGLKQLFVYGGTFLVDRTTGNILATNLDQHEPFEATYVDQAVVVYGNVRSGMTLYAPRANRIFVNGRPRQFVRSGAYVTF